MLPLCTLFLSHYLPHGTDQVQLSAASTFNFVALYVYGIMGSGRLTWERDARLFDVKHWIKQGWSEPKQVDIIYHWQS